MPSTERPEGGRDERHEPTPYLRIARFSAERPAERAYFQAQEAIFKAEDCDLSTYRFHLNRIWHVAVLGEQPSADLERQLRRILSRGEPASLPESVLAELARRRAQATKLGPWLERHYRPGKQL